MVKRCLVAALAVIIALLAVVTPALASSLKEYYSTGYDGVKDVYGNRWFSQTVTASTSYYLQYSEIYVVRVGATGKTATLHVRAVDSGTGKPTGADLCTSTLPSENISTSIGWVRFPDYSSSHYFTTGDKYAVILSYTGIDASRMLDWGQDTTSPTYTGGSVVYSLDAGATWTVQSTLDLYFRNYGIKALPSGVASFTGAVTDEGEITLSWTNSGGQEGVRVLVGYEDYYTDKDDAPYIYQGAAASYAWPGAPVDVADKYFTIWEYNETGWSAPAYFFFRGGRDGRCVTID